MLIKESVHNVMGYNRWSRFYDQYPNPTVAIDDLAFPLFWKDLKGKRVLEIGCGTGRHTQKLISLGNEVVGIDLSDGMLKVAQSKLSDASKVKFIHADFMSYSELEPQSFDAVVSSLVIEHIYDLNRFFQKLKYVLKENGKFYLSEIHPERAANGSTAHFKDNQSSELIFLESTAHSSEKIENAARSNEFEISFQKSVKGTELVKIKSEWNKYMDINMIQIWVFKAQSI